jgi:hypothetical protein
MSSSYVQHLLLKGYVQFLCSTLVIRRLSSVLMTKDQLFLRVNEKYGFENKKKRDYLERLVWRSLCLIYFLLDYSFYFFATVIPLY